MTYTVKTLAKLSGISIRTLHWYDKQGLLKPSFYGSNGYRYYEQEKLLLLQEILFFRKLGFTLTDIKNLLAKNTAEKIAALNQHKAMLEEEMILRKKLIKAIEDAIFKLSQNGGHESNNS